MDLSSHNTSEKVQTSLHQLTAALTETFKGVSWRPQAEKSAIKARKAWIYKQSCNKTYGVKYQG